eukprot:56850-Chlamydomonas_euryale.AAC.1
MVPVSAAAATSAFPHIHTCVPHTLAHTRAHTCVSVASSSRWRASAPAAPDARAASTAPSSAA